MNALIDKLRDLFRSSPVEDFKWDIPDLPATCNLQFPSNCVSNYSKNIFLKEKFGEFILSDETLNNHYWIINHWGGIGSYKRTDKNNLKISRFLDRLERKTLTREYFDCISSLSKVASFAHPTHYAIYDSRAIYSLNWLLFNYSTVRKLELFPQPIGRGTNLKKYDTQTIFELAKLNGGRDFTYISHKHAFHRYCSLLKELAQGVFGPGSKPYSIEMLLFMIAPTIIISEIESQVSLTIKI